VSKYESTAVCDTYPQGIIMPTACESLLQEMPSSQPHSEFVGPGDKPSYTGYSRLPKIYVHGERTISQNELAQSYLCMHSQKLIIRTLVARDCYWTSLRDLRHQGSAFRILHREMVQYLGGGGGYYEYVRSARNGRQCFQTW